MPHKHNNIFRHQLLFTLRNLHSNNKICLATNFVIVDELVSYNPKKKRNDKYNRINLNPINKFDHE